jgi:hypothetical protein
VTTVTRRVARPVYSKGEKAEETMIQFTDDATQDCEIRAVFAMDVLDKVHRLQIEHVAVTTSLGACGLGKQKCAHLREWINKRRITDGKAKLKKEEKITPATTIAEVIAHVC